MRILLVEDERKVAQFIEKGLAEAAYTPVVARNCAEARDRMSEGAFDAVVLDLGLPDGDGLDLLKQWRSAGNNEPVLILSARDAVLDRVRGLNVGADDYLPKPFSFDELLARLRSLLRRHATAKSTVLAHRGVRLDLLARTVTVGDRPVEMTNREFALLELFLQNTGRVLTRTMIAERVWDVHHDMETNLIDVYVRRLRAKIEQDSARPLIKTLRGSGYQML